METPTEQIKIDLKDKKIMQALSNNSKIALSKLTKDVKLSRDAVNYRIKRLEEKGVIKTFTTKLNYKLLGFYKYRVFILIDEEKLKTDNEFINFLKSNKNIIQITHYHDKWDFELTILARDIAHFDKIVTQITSRFPRLIIEKDSLAIISEYTNQTIPFALERNEIKKLQNNKSDSEKQTKTDKKDFEILRELCKDCRQSAYDIGSKVDLSSDAVIYRMKKLEESGIIEKYTVKFDLNKLGYSSYGIGGNMKTFDDRNENKLKEFIKGQENIISGVKTIGTWEFLLHLAVTEPDDFHKIIKDLKKTFVESIKNYDVWIVYEEKYFNPFPEGICE